MIVVVFNIEHIFLFQKFIAPLEKITKPRKQLPRKTNVIKKIESLNF
jgi:hypothetical protein